MKFIALKTDNGKITGKIAFYDYYVEVLYFLFTSVNLQSIIYMVIFL